MGGVHHFNGDLDDTLSTILFIVCAVGQLLFFQISWVGLKGNLKKNWSQCYWNLKQIITKGIIWSIPATHKFPFKWRTQWLWNHISSKVYTHTKKPNWIWSQQTWISTSHNSCLQLLFEAYSSRSSPLVDCIMLRACQFLHGLNAYLDQGPKDIVFACWLYTFLKPENLY